MKQVSLFLALVLMLTQASSQKSSVFAPDGKAIKGYDPVAFFTDSKAVMGSDTISYKWNDATWMFATKANRDLFIASPEKYAPQYGGYCAYGTSEGHKAPTQTDTWTVVDGKLYFNYNKNVQKAWTKDRAGLIEKADKAWPEIKDKE